MKPRRSFLTYHSFADLKDLVKVKPLPRLKKPEPDLSRNRDQDPPTDEAVFAKAMEGVAPIERDNCIRKTAQVTPLAEIREREDSEAMTKLKDLVRYGIGFNVADTPEYIEGTGYHVPQAIAKRLHRGDYSIEAHVDLHGYNVAAAREVFEEFLKWAVLNSKKGVLIVHGRGLCSPSEPVLKRKVEHWLTRSVWRKWVVAYCSARKCDGGAGATYVLLRGRPVSKSFKLGRWKVSNRGKDESTI